MRKPEIDKFLVHFHVGNESANDSIEDCGKRIYITLAMHFFANFCTSFSLDSWIQILVQKFAVGYKINRYVVCLCVCFLFKSSFSYIMQNIKFD